MLTRESVKSGTSAGLEQRAELLTRRLKSSQMKAQLDRPKNDRPKNNSPQNGDLRRSIAQR
jgi:hypothetical protein